MSLGFPAFFRQFWLHFRKNLRKYLEKQNVWCNLPFFYGVWQMRAITGFFTIGRGKAQFVAFFFLIAAISVLRDQVQPKRVLSKCSSLFFAAIFFLSLIGKPLWKSDWQTRFKQKSFEQYFSCHFVGDPKFSSSDFVRFFRPLFPSSEPNKWWKGNPLLPFSRTEDWKPNQRIPNGERRKTDLRPSCGWVRLAAIPYQKKNTYNKLRM